MIPAEHEIKTIDDGLIRKILSCPDKMLTRKNLKDAFKLIEDGTGLKKKEKKELRALLGDLYSEALPDFRKGGEHNPLYHHTQVLYNMVRLGLGEKRGYDELRNMLILALLHDIGNAICTRPKVTNSMVKRAFSDADSKKCNKLFEEAIDLARKGREFRLEHMDKGPGLIGKVTDKCIKNGLLEEEDLHLVCRAVVIHDYPSIEQNLNILRKRKDRELSNRELGKTKEIYITNGTLDRLTEVADKYEAGAFLLPFADPAIGKLITFLREADRLFMVSVQGVIKDLKDKQKITAVQEITTVAVKKRAGENIESHEDEYELYSQAGKDDKKFKGDGKIKNKSLYRTDTGYNTIFDEAKKKYKYKSKKASSSLSPSI